MKDKKNNKLLWLILDKKINYFVSFLLLVIMFCFLFPSNFFVLATEERVWRPNPNPPPPIELEYLYLSWILFYSIAIIFAIIGALFVVKLVAGLIVEKLFKAKKTADSIQDTIKSSLILCFGTFLGYYFVAKGFKAVLDVAIENIYEVRIIRLLISWTRIHYWMEFVTLLLTALIVFVPAYLFAQKKIKSTLKYVYFFLTLAPFGILFVVFLVMILN